MSPFPRALLCVAALLGTGCLQGPFFGDLEFTVEAATSDPLVLTAGEAPRRYTAEALLELGADDPAATLQLSLQAWVDEPTAGPDGTFPTVVVTAEPPGGATTEVLRTPTDALVGAEEILPADVQCDATGCSARVDLALSVEGTGTAELEWAVLAWATPVDDADATEASDAPAAGRPELQARPTVTIQSLDAVGAD